MLGFPGLSVRRPCTNANPPLPCPRPPRLYAMQKLSESMNIEMAPKGVHVQCQVPLMVATKLAKVGYIH